MKTKTKKQTLKDLPRILAVAGDAVVEILPDGEVRLLDADPAVDKAFNAGVEACARWHKSEERRHRKIDRKVSAMWAEAHCQDADALRKLKR